MHANKKNSNPCIRCGRERIVAKKWKERVETYFGTSLVVYTETVCPNKDCQKIVNKQNTAQKKSRDKIKKEREDRAKAHKKNGQDKRVKK